MFVCESEQSIENAPTPSGCWSTNDDDPVMTFPDVTRLGYNETDLRSTYTLTESHSLQMENMASAQKFKKAYASCSIGINSRATLPEKLSAISAAGFNGIELSFPDLHSFTKQFLEISDIAEDDFLSLCKGASSIKSLCDSLGLKIFMLQPFSNFEGWPKGSKEREEVFSKAKGWIEIMQHAGIDMLQVLLALVLDQRLVADSSRSAHPIRLEYRVPLMTSFKISVSLLICWQCITSVSLMRIGVGQRMLRNGVMCGT